MNDDDIVSQLFTNEEVSVYESDDTELMNRVARALTAPNVIVKKLVIYGGLCIGGAKALCSALESNSTVQELTFHNKRKNGSSATPTQGLSVDLARALKVNTSIEKFSLRWNYIGDVGARVLAETLVCDNTTLKELSLVYCGIGDDGAAELGRVLSVNATLEVLDLHCNVRIGNDGAVALTDGLVGNKNLKRLDLGRCGIGNKGVAALGEVLKVNKSLEILDLDPKPDIGREGAGELADGLSWNTSLLQLNLPRRLDTDRIEGYLQANQFIKVYCEREHEAIFYKLWPLIYAKVSNHPAALYFLLKETNMDELISNQL
jgi:Ran GTPase-activating protein (RanGAP) involved in mRNA processing and transport